MWSDCLRQAGSRRPFTGANPLLRDMEPLACSVSRLGQCVLPWASAARLSQPGPPQGSPRESISMPGLARTPDRHGSLAGMTPVLTPSPSQASK
ncbi:hypothetical protein ACOMHN_001708 [Nucella lapillus]